VAGEYEQFCSVARALDVVGDRWTLLIIRELLFGKRRYRELQHDLPGIATNLLAGRLHRLEAEGLVLALPTDDRRGRAYELTAAGRRLQPVLEALALFGLSNLLPDRAPAGSAFRTHWLELPVRAIFVPGALTDDLVVRFEVDAEPPAEAQSSLQLRITPDAVVRNDDARPDVIVGGDPGALLAAVRDASSLAGLHEQGRLRTSGSRRDLARLRRALRLPVAVGV
jgi:DNA-binding HxlR family transcriptional regulator